MEVPASEFIGFAEGYVLAALKKAGVPLQRIRPALDHLQRELGIDHALASRSLYTDGAELLYDYAESHGDTPEARSARDLVVVRNNQRVFTDIVEAYLRRIEFADDERAALIHLPQYVHADVVVDPQRSFGAPIFARGQPHRRRAGDVQGRREPRHAGRGVRRAPQPPAGRLACQLRRLTSPASTFRRSSTTAASVG